MIPTKLSTFNWSQALLIRSWRSFSMTSSTRRKTRGRRTRFFFRRTKWSDRRLFKWPDIPRQRELKYYMEDMRLMQARDTLCPGKRSPMLHRLGIMELWFVSRLKSHLNPVTEPLVVTRGSNKLHPKTVKLERNKEKMGLKTNCFLLRFHLFSKASKSLSHQLQ